MPLWIAFFSSPFGPLLVSTACLCASCYAILRICDFALDLWWQPSHAFGLAWKNDHSPISTLDTRTQFQLLQPFVAERALCNTLLTHRILRVLFLSSPHPTTHAALTIPSRSGSATSSVPFSTPTSWAKDYVHLSLASPSCPSVVLRVSSATELLLISI